MITELADNALTAGRKVRLIVNGLAEPLEIDRIDTNDICVRFYADDRYWSIRADALIGFEAWPAPTKADRGFR